ncbi:hypothetical protein FACS1894109_02130 [Spirochaetia bacterium]|nr:hypothetical protein FACS1894109_02130 [Spirochaetia bacterium]GHU73738.1 hypothetical protein FACS189450_14060 [Spirochaetia bacterium]GHU91721.1 hypothetical protein FACS189476_12420 [Spirochaetia bacterium]GHV03113.1 hypothetical protein FACS189485_05380 [Spirochaetia bacterium]
MTDIEIKTGITDAECERMDKYYTENTFELGPNLLKLGIKPGEVRNMLLLRNMDRDVVDYVRSQAAAAHKSQTEIVNEIIHEKIAVGI